MLRLVVSRSARADMRAIGAYIGRDSLVAARHVHDKFREAFLLLQEFPEIGHLREDLTDLPVRFWGVYSYLIIYRVEKRTLRIVRIVSGHRDIETLLS